MSLVGFLVVVAGLFTLVVLQIVDGWPALRDRSVASYGELKDFLLASPLHLTEGQLNGYVRDAVAALQQDSQPLLRGALSIGSTAGHVGAGLVLDALLDDLPARRRRRASGAGSCGSSRAPRATRSTGRGGPAG